MTGLSCAQMDRLVRRFREHGQVKESGYRRHRFPLLSKTRLTSV